MNYLKLVAVIIIGSFIMLSSCMKPEEPTNVQILTGEWEVTNTIANDQLDLPVFEERAVLHLDRNETFLFINVDGRAKSGTWSEDGDKLSLETKQGTTIYNIVYLDYEKLHVYYTFYSDQAGEIELRYLFERVK